MVLVDSSVWIDFFNGRCDGNTTLLRRLLPSERLLVGDLILVEVLSGFRSDADFRKARELLATLKYTDLVGADVAFAAAENYRLLRRRGVTVRKVVDVVIASFCVLYDHHLLHTDHDFEAMAPHLGLRTL